jgi:uncharacterized protein with FMN-binding domain
MRVTNAGEMPAPQKLRTRLAAASFASLGLLSIAGCAVESATADSSMTSGSDASQGSSDTSSAEYTDGTYTAQASYQTPSGTESISVELTIAGDTVTAVTVSGSATDHESAEFQSRFASGISKEVVGKDLSSLSVSRVSGSSLTSNGFNAALDDIRSQAA